jgi:hypothetical protein
MENKKLGTAAKLATKNEGIFKLFILIIYSSVSDPYLESGFRRAKMTLKNRKNVKKFHVFLAEGFSCSLDVLYGAQGFK